MNKKLIAVAVASTLAAPAVHAEITPYGRVNVAVDLTDSGSSNTTDVSNVSSRFGFRGTGDIGNGLTAIGRYEFATVADKEQPGIADIRLAYAGISGGFGSITIGNQWSAYFDTFGTLVSPTYSIGYYLYSSVAGGPFRTSNTIKYANSFGPVSLEADLRLNESGEGSDVAEKINGDGFGIGLSINPIEMLTIAVAVDSEENNSVTDEDTGAVTNTPDTDRVGVGARLNFGSFGVNLGHQTREDGNDEINHDQVYFDAGFGKTSVLVGFGQVDSNTSSAEPSSTFLGVYHNMGGGLRLYLETTTVDSDDGSDDLTRTLLGMRVDF